jgi:hypothetical protein
VRILIRRWTSQAGQRIADDRKLDARRLRIGRGTDQDIELPDLRVALAHAEIVQNERHAMLIARGRAIVMVNDEPTTEHKLRNGDVIDIGRFRLVIAPAPAGADFQVEIEERVTAHDEKTVRQRRRLTLADAGLSRRMPSLALFIAILFLGLVLPAGLRFGFSSPGPQPATATAARAAAGSNRLHADRIWLPGTFSDAHAYFKTDCAKCHQTPFASVRNSACQSCHQDAHAHITDKRWLAQPVFAQARCTDCHQEHHGSAGLVRRDEALCGACHAQIQKKFPGSHMDPATSFSMRHPVFTPLVARYQPEAKTFHWIQARMDQPAQLYSQTNLKYRHDKHLDPGGIMSPTGRRILHCNDCHVPDASGTSFKPVSMQRDCAGCHRLDFDPDAPQRTVPHGEPQQVISVIRDFYAHEALAGRIPASDVSTEDPGRPHAQAPSSSLTPEDMQAWAAQRASRAITEIFTVRSCVVCHTVEATADAALPYRVLPVAPPVARYLTGALTFNHAVHRDEPCASCHAATKSKAATDVLLPTIKRCRDCHGDAGTAAMVQSTCIDCHGYHIVGSGDTAAERPRLSSISKEAERP